MSVNLDGCTLGTFDAVEDCCSDMTSNPEPSISPAAARMRRHRRRRREGLRCLTVELRETEIDMLVCKALLKPEMRNNRIAIINAVHTHFDQTLSMPR
jgi:hypothetical protein